METMNKYPQWFVDELLYDEDRKRALDGTLKSRDSVYMICPIHGQYKTLVCRRVKISTGERVYGCEKCGRNKVSEIKMNNRRFPEWFVEELAPEYKDCQFKVTDKVEFICEVHGRYVQKVASHIKISTGERKRGCPHCGHIDSFRNKRIIPEWAISEMVNEKDKEEARQGIISSSKIVEWRCDKHGVYKQKFGSHVRVKYGIPGNRCPRCMIGNYRSKFELKVEEWCVDHGWRLGPRKGVIYSPDNRPMELDIYLPDQGIAIECDGDIWHGEGDKEDPYGRTHWVGYHKWKDDKCAEQGIKLFHILYSEWVKKGNRDRVYKEIEDYVRGGV